MQTNNLAFRMEPRRAEPALDGSRAPATRSAPAPLLAAALIAAGAASWHASSVDSTRPPLPASDRAVEPWKQVSEDGPVPAQPALAPFLGGDRPVARDEESLLPWLLSAPLSKTRETARPAPEDVRVREERVVPEPMPERLRPESLTGLIEYAEGGLLGRLSFSSRSRPGRTDGRFTILAPRAADPEDDRLKGVDFVQASSWKREPPASTESETKPESKILRAVRETEKAVRERVLGEQELGAARSMQSRSALGARMALSALRPDRTARHMRRLGLEARLRTGTPEGTAEEQAIAGIRKLGELPYVAYLFPPEVAALGGDKPMCRLAGAVCRMPTGHVFSLQPDPVAKLLGWPTIGELVRLGIAVFPSPLVFDLDGDGVRTAERRVGFDIDGDGILDRLHDASSGDGVLVFDADGDGIAGESARELFGTGTDLDGDSRSDGFADGFAALRALVEKAQLEGRLPSDDSTDGWLGTSALEALELAYGLRMRRGGLNGKAVTLREAGVARVRLSGSAPVLIRDVDGQGNDVMRQAGASFERLDGSRGDYEDLWFRAWTPWARLSRGPKRGSWKSAPKA